MELNTTHTERATGRTMKGNEGKKEQKEGKTIRPSHYDVQLKTIFKHDTPSANQYTSVPAQQSNMMYTTKNKF